jgi:hypothetical protein
MSLPKQILPIFSLTVPSTQKKVQYRQFTIKEEKIMAQAKESDDLEVIKNAVKEVIKLCVPSVDVGTLSLFDVEYMITKIRAKSVGERIELNMLCDKDEKHRPIPAVVDLEKVEVKFPEGHSKKIELYQGTGVVMRYPTLNDLDAIEDMDIIDAVVMCIDQIYTTEEVYQAADQTKEELRDYVEGLTEAQFEKIEQTFFRKMPVFEYELQYKCLECGHEHKKMIRGLASFFS